MSNLTTDHGFAHSIMKHAETLLRKAGCPKINLQVRKIPLQTIELFKRIDYSQDPVVSFGKRLEEDQNQ